MQHLQVGHAERKLHALVARQTTCPSADGDRQGELEKVLQVQFLPKKRYRLTVNLERNVRLTVNPKEKKEGNEEEENNPRQEAGNPNSNRFTFYLRTYNVQDALTINLQVSFTLR